MATAKNAALVPVVTPAKTAAEVSWTGIAGVEEKLKIDIPNFQTLTTHDFERQMDKACSDFRGHYAQAGVQLAAVILPGLEDAKRRFKNGEVIEGCEKIEQYIRHLGFTPEQVRQWRHRLNDLMKKLPKPKNGRRTSNGGNNKEQDEQETVTPVTVETPALPPPQEFVPGEWTQAFYGNNYDEEFRGKPKNEWVNTDGRRILKVNIVAPGQEKKPWGERKRVDMYMVSDKYGSIGKSADLAEAKKMLRPVSTTAEVLDKADSIAKIMRNLDVDESLKDFADEYLAMRRIVVHDDEDSEEDGKRRKPRYEITLTVEGSRKDALMEQAKAMFGNALVGVELMRIGGGKAEDLDVAEDEVNDALKIVNGLKGDLEAWKETRPENFQGDQKEEEIDMTISKLEEIEDALNGIDWDIEFPGAF